MIERDKIKDIEIPYDEKGQMGYEYNYGYKEVEMKPNIPFKCSMDYQGFSKGRSSVKLHFNGSDGLQYEMFATDFDSLVKEFPVNKPLEGEWVFVKRGANFGLVKIIEE